MPPTPKTAERRGARRNNAIANALRVFQGLEGLSEVPYLTPLKPISTPDASVRQQTIRKLRDEHTELIDRIKQLAQVLGDGTGAVMAQVRDLERALEEIVVTLEEERQLTWFQRVRKTQELKDNIMSCTAKLDAFIERFTVGSLLQIQQLLSKDKEEVQNLKDSDTFLERSFQSLSHATLFRGRLTYPHPQSRVVIKRYHQDDTTKVAFKRDVALLQRLRHPNLHQLMGTSVNTASSPFLVLPECTPSSLSFRVSTSTDTMALVEHGDVTDFIDRRLNGDSVDSFMATLRVCQGIASGMEYLRRECSALHHSELEACFQRPNIVLTPDGQPILGHNLVLGASTTAPETTPLELGTWLKTRYHDFIDSIIYEQVDLSNWDLIMARKKGRRASHIRLLEHFTSHFVPSFTDVTVLLDTLLDTLERARQRNELSFRTIRSAALRLWSGAFLYWPKTPVRCALGDIGYMREDGEFVVVARSSELLVQGQCDGDEDEDTLKLTGPNAVAGCSNGSGTIRHQFGKTIYASIRRHKMMEMLPSIAEAWFYFIRNAKAICETASKPEVPLKVSDLILIVGVEEDLRASFFDRKGTPDELPCEVEFVEIENPLEGASWGHWHTENVEGACILDIRRPQSLLFVQLEEEDIE
ncbi:hypothetical protein EYR40_009929 [Pleurotus pulmonarius]|nr:hypothetical protein EYR40_009929 [Pleurotus pulmonarius]